MRERELSSPSFCGERVRLMNKRVSLAMAAAIAAFLCTAMSARAAGSFVDVSQPISRNGSDVIICNMTYWVLDDRESHPELEVRLTVTPNHVPVAPAYDDQGTQTDLVFNNAASGFQLRFPKGAIDSTGARFTGLFGDTLVVVMDLSEALKARAGESAPWSEERFHEVVEKTVQCLLLNARRRWPRIRHVALSIDGSHAYEHWEGVYPLEKVGPGVPLSEPGGKAAHPE